MQVRSDRGEKSADGWQEKTHVQKKTDVSIKGL